MTSSAAGVRVISSFDSSGERGFLGLPHFWHEGPHVPRRNAGSRREGPATTISGTGAILAKFVAVMASFGFLVTTGCSVVTHGEVVNLALSDLAEKHLSVHASGVYLELRYLSGVAHGWYDHIMFEMRQHLMNQSSRSSAR